MELKRAASIKSVWNDRRSLKQSEIVNSAFACTLSSCTCTLCQTSPLPVETAAHKPSSLRRGDVSANSPADRPPPAQRCSAAAAGFTVDVWIWLRPANVALLSNWKNTFPHNAVCLHPSIHPARQLSGALPKDKPTFLLIHPRKQHATTPSTWRPYRTVNLDSAPND